MSTAQMQDYNTFTDVTGTTVGLTSAWDMIGTENDDAGTNDYWDMDQEGTVNNAYPILSWQDGADDILFELPYSGGSGTSGDPYQIATTDDLIELSNTSADWDKHFIQTADIAFDATEINVDWNGDGSTGPAEGFSPIGNNTTNFTGSYDGQNHTIDNLFINRLFEAYIGLFGNTMNAIIRNLGVTNIDITGDYYTGALIGSSESGSVSNCYSTGSVSGDYDIGGLIGSAFGGSVSDSYSSCTVTGSNYYIGGLIGSNSNSIDNCYSTGDVEGSDNVGGLLGFNSGAVSQSYSTGSVSADYSWKVGGLIGINMMASIENCYSTSDVTTGLDISEQTVGAFIGSNGDGTEGAAGGDVSYCYATGDVVYDGGTNPTDKGFVGVSVATGDQTPVYTANFFDSEASNQSSDAVEAATAKTTTEMQTQSTYTNAGWDFIVETTNGTDDIWKSTITYPHFACFIPPTQACEVGCSDAGSGSLELSWTRGNGDGNAVFIAQASNGTASPVDNEEYTANTEFGSGEQIGASGWYCVYVGTGTSVTVTGLSSETAYRVHVCEYNLGSIYYNDETSTNNPQNYEEPVVVELSAFKAQISNATVTLTWSTEGETGTAGFHIYRSADRNGSYGRVNAALIAATGAATRGADYDYIDDEPLSGDAFYKLQSVDVDGSTQFSRAVSTALTGVEEQNMPERFALHQNYPNPFNPTTTLRYDLPQDAHVTCVVYNVQGQKLATLIDSHKPAGEHAYTWNAAERFSSGLYIIVMRAGEQVFRQKVSLVK
ncbi:MAG: GLUG motif-containing protein [candidate division KSB1 bacterium]|nr:GLUG motif-containing protein [candidate division KSB1 bacterium]